MGGVVVGQDLCIQLPIRTGGSMPSNWTRRRGSVPSNLEIARQQPLHSFVILNDQYHVHSVYSDLEPPASTGNRDERWRTPAIHRAASVYAFASLSSEAKAIGEPHRYNRDRP